MKMHLLDRFRSAVECAGDKVAITEYQKDSGQRRWVSYQQLDDLSTRLAQIFLEKGICPRDVVSFQLPNSIEFAASHIACLKIGAISNPLMPIFRERELDYMLRHIKSKLVLYREGFRGFSYSQMYASLASRNSALLPCEIFLLLEEYQGVELPNFEAYTACEDDIVEMMFTSGTTGSPKAVMHSSATVSAAVKPYIERLSLGGSDVFYMGAPLAHATGFLYGLWSAFFLGAKFVVQDIWDADLAWEAIRKEGVTFTMGATPFLADLLEAHQESETSTLKTFVCGGAPVPRALVKAARAALHINIIAVWGMTECGVATSTFLSDSEEKICGTDGAPYEGFFIKVVGMDGETLAAGQEGKLFVKGPSLLKGYFGMDQSTLLSEGWFDTGDLATIDKDGYVRITGRSKDIIIRGGENIPVVEIENVLYKMPGIVDVAIVGEAHPRLGETGVCFATLKPDHQLDLDAVQCFLKAEEVAKNYWPERVVCIDEMPRTPSGKIQKFALRKRLEDELEL